MFIIEKTWKLEQIFILLFSLITISTIFSVATILRNTDGSFETYFYLAASGVRHTSTSLATFTRLDVNECFYKCVIHLKCQSISFSTSKGGICDLSDYRYNGEADLLFEDAEWNYYDTYDKCASNPCFMFDSCQDITEAPGFHCKCKFRYEGARCDKFNNETGVKFPQGMVGKWKLNYSIKYRNTYTIKADGSVTLGTNGVTRMFEPSDNQDKFPSSQGWFLVKNLFRTEVWEYVRLKEDGGLEIHHFCSDSCQKVWIGVGQYCCVALGTKEVEIPKEMVGKWKVVYTSGTKVTYLITSDGDVTKEDNKVTKIFEPSDKQDMFPSSQGWFLVKNLHDEFSWEYMRLEGAGVLKTHYFCEGCTSVMDGIRQYCCVGSGSEELAAPLEKNGNWILLDENICFQPKKKDKYGAIKMSYKVDKIGGILLQHKDGKVSCIKDQEGTYWGCNDDKLYMFITNGDDENGRLLPPTTVTSSISEYTLPNYNSMSQLLALTQDGSFSMEKDGDLRIWHQTGLKDGGNDDDNYSGKTCASVYADIRDAWLIQDSKICYNPKGGYRKFKLKVPGILNGLKLVHIEGNITCGGTQTKWGCGTELSVIVTNDNDKRIFPFGGRTASYDVEGYTPRSPELIFKLPDHFISKEVRKGQKLRIWYGKDLNKEKVGHGKTCTAVYARLKDGMILLTPNVCFEGKNDKYGEFELDFDGHIFGIKLKHQSGKIGCRNTKETKWGCDDKVSVFITNEQDEVLFPTYYNEDFTYSNSGILDNEVLFLDIGKALQNAYEKNDELRVYSGEVFYKKDTDNNQGKACFEVYANITGFNKIYGEID